jgi:hypothetical protein
MSEVASPLHASYCIRVLLPDDGTDRHLLTALWHEQNITRADSIAVRSVGVLQAARTPPGRLPEAELARLVTVIVDNTEADTLFDYICVKSNIDRPGGGMVVMERLVGATPFSLPAGVPDEMTHHAGAFR